MRYLDYSQLVENGSLRVREQDRHRAESLVDSAKRDALVASAIQITEESATVVLRVYYEAIRQLGEAAWRVKGFEPLNHEVSLDVLFELNILPDNLLSQLQQYRKIRNDANYRGVGATQNQARQIAAFWDTYNEKIIHEILKS